MAAVLSLTPDEWQRLGLGYVGFSVSHQNCCDRTNSERFQAHYGVGPATLDAVFVDLQTTNIAAARIAKPKLKYFLMTMYWCKTYPTEAAVAGVFNVNEKTVRDRIKEYLNAMAALKGMKVRRNVYE